MDRNTRRTAPMAAVTLFLAVAVLAGCSSGSDDDKEPAKTATATVTATPELSAEEQRAACVDAWATVIGDRPANWDPETGEDPEPAECAGLPQDDYTDRYFEGLQQANKAGRDELGDCLDDPACTSFPVDP